MQSTNNKRYENDIKIYIWYMCNKIQSKKYGQCDNDISKCMQGPVEANST